MATEPILGSGGKTVQEPRLKAGSLGRRVQGREGEPRCPGARAQADADSVSSRVSPRRCDHREDEVSR